MAVMEGVTYSPVVGSGYSKMKAYNFLVIHTIVGYDDGGSAAHWTTRFDGFIWQRRDTIYQSAACWNGNPDCLAIENEDHGSAYGNWNTNDGHAVPAFTEAQCEAIAEIIVWSHHTHGIPIELVPDTKPGRRGIAYHRQGIPGNYLSEGYAYGGIVPGGTQWSKHAGKVCPGDRRITQLIEVIIPRARQLAGLDPMSVLTVEEDDMLFRNVGPDGKERWAHVTGKMIMGLSSGELESALEQAEAGRVAVRWVDTATWDSWVKFRNVEEEVQKQLVENNAKLQENNELLQQLVTLLTPKE
jgi:hypothetical protein